LNSQSSYLCLLRAGIIVMHLDHFYILAMKKTGKIIEKKMIPFTI
jgi:hypothetical protein